MREILIQHVPAQESAPARVRVSYRAESGAQPQQWETEFKFTVTDEQRRLIQWYLEQYLIFPWGEFCNRAKKVEEMLEQLGAELFKAVFSDPHTARLYGHVADHLGETRIVIHASKAEGIALPWECLRDPTAEFGDIARLAHTFVRSQPDLIFLPPAKLEGGETFNILMVICRPGGPEGDVPFQSVARPLLELFRPHRDRIRLDILRPPTFEQLARELGNKPNFYHVLHFDGHGAFPPLAGHTGYGDKESQGRLLFESEGGNHREVTGEELGGLLAGKGVPVVLLNACQSGMTHPGALYPSVGNQLLKAGARGVVAMAYSVYVQTAVRFMARLYEGLINGEELARAVALGREELRAHPQRLSPIGAIDLRDWVVPVLFEAATFTPLPRKVVSGLRLNADILKEEQGNARAEIDCPKQPAFGLMGRDSVMLELERAFQHETVVLLEGMAGVGKTEVAIGFARWRAETGALDGPIFFFRFVHYMPLAQVCDRIGQVFQAVIKQQLQVEWHLLKAAQRRALAMNVLKQVPCFLVWDNFEPVAGFPTGMESDWKPEEQQKLRDFLSDLRSGATKVLLTSRRDEPWLGPIYQRVELGGLKLAESQELAVKVLQRAGLNHVQIRDLPDYNALLRYLHGNPLALQVILPELKRTMPDALLRAVQAGEVKLTDDDPKQGRELSLAVSLTYQLDKLDPILRSRLGLLAMFHGIIDSHVLAIICMQKGAPDLIRGLNHDDWERILNAAAEIGLLRSVDQRFYEVHPALPWFFHDLLQEALPEHSQWAERSFAEVYASCGSALSGFLLKTNAQSAISMLRAEENNLVHALLWARRCQHWVTIEGILHALRALWTTQGRWVEWERLVVMIEAEVTDVNGEPLSGGEDLWRALLGHRCRIADYYHDFNISQEIYLRLKDHYERAGKVGHVAAQLHQLGRIAEQRRQFDKAEGWYQACLAISKGTGDKYTQASTLHHLGNIAYLRRRFEDAESSYQESLAIRKHIGDALGQAGILHQLGNIAFLRDQLDEAKCTFQECLRTYERIGDIEGQAMSLHNLGMIAEEKQQFDEAESCYRQSLAIEEQIGNLDRQASTLLQLGNSAFMQRRFDEAERWYKQSLAIVQRIGDEHGQAGALHNLAKALDNRGNKEEAVRFYEQAEEMFTRLDDQHNLAIVRKSLQRVRGSEGRTQAL